MTAIEILSRMDEQTKVRFTDSKVELYSFRRAIDWMRDPKINLGIEVKRIEPVENSLVLYI